MTHDSPRSIQRDLLRDRAVGRNVTDWTDDEIAKLQRGYNLRKRALEELRKGIARDQARLDALSEAHQLAVPEPQRGG